MVVHSVKEPETLPAKVIGSVTPAIRSRGGGSWGASTASRGIVRVGSDVRRGGVLANVLDGHKSSVDKPAVSGNILVTIRVDVAHLATGVADGLGVGLGLPTRVMYVCMLTAHRCPNGVTSSPCFCSMERPSTIGCTTKWCRSLAACPSGKLGSTSSPAAPFSHQGLLLNNHYYLSIATCCCL